MARCLARRRRTPRECRPLPSLVRSSAASARRLAAELFAYRDLGPLAVRGVADLVQAWQVLGPSAHASRSEMLYAAAAQQLIGRDEELGALLRAWRQASSGHGRLVLLTGEPGIGKSRLLAALEESIAAEPHVSLRYLCSPLHHDSTLHPVVARWEQEAGFARGDSNEARLRKLEAIVAPAGMPPEDVASIAAMLSVPTSDRYRQPELNPQQRKERTFTALQRRLESMARSHPVLMLFEDAQWADPSSLELLDALIDRLPGVADSAHRFVPSRLQGALDRSRRHQPDSAGPAGPKGLRDAGRARDHRSRTQPRGAETDRHAGRWRAAVH